MSEYVLSCCSTADLTKEHLEKRNIKYVCFHYALNDKEYFDDLGESMPFDEFYQAMKDGADTRTSQINTDEYIDYFEPFLEQGLDILHLTLSSGLSGTINSAKIAQIMLKEKYPNRKIFIVDSLAASSGYGLLMDKLADLRDLGLSIEELCAWAEEHKTEVNHWFFSTDLTFYIKGGRISKTAGFIGGVMNICPLLDVDYEGKLIPRQKIRTKKRAIMEVVKIMKKLAKDGLDYSDKCYISNSACYEDAKAVADLIETSFPHLKGKVEIYSVGTTIGSHTVPGTIALFFWGKKREA